MLHIQSWDPTDVTMTCQHYINNMGVNLLPHQYNVVPTHHEPCSLGYKVGISNCDCQENWNINHLFLLDS